MLTHRAGLSPVEPSWYHLTLAHSAPVGELADAEVAAIVDQVTAGCARVRPFEITLRPPQPGTVAIECLGWPGQPTRELWRLVTGVAGAVTAGRVPVVPGAHYPHVALAYATGQVDPTPLKAWLTDHDVAPVTLPVRQISLVAQVLDVPLG